MYSDNIYIRLNEKNNLKTFGNKFTECVCQIAYAKVNYIGLDILLRSRCIHTIGVNHTKKLVTEFSVSIVSIR